MPNEVISFIKRAIRDNKDPQPTSAYIEKVDGNLADIRLEGHATFIHNCRIAGDPNALKVGMLVSIVWEDYNGTPRPVIQGGSSGVGLSQAPSNIVVDNTTIEYSGDGLRVKAGGIGLQHLNFDPFAGGTSIGDLLPGWSVTSDGILHNNQLSLSPYGEITLGTDPDIVKISMTDASYRIWAGALAPASAPFSVSKTGHLISSSATIAGWTINTTEIKKTGIVLDSANDQIKVGASAPNIVIDGGSKIIKSSNFSSGVSGFGLYASNGDAEFNNVVVRGTIRASVFNIGEITATAGTSGTWKSAAEVYTTTTLTATGTSDTINIKNSDASPGTALFAIYDVIRMKAWNGSGIIDVWGTITSIATHTGYSTYTFKIESGGGVTVNKGTAVADYGVTGSGFITQSADGTIGSSPNISMIEVTTGQIYTHALQAAGTGYTPADVLTIAGGTGGTITVNTVSSGPPGPIATYTLTTPGYAYTTGVKSLSGGTGSSATLNITAIHGPWDTGQTLKVRLGNMNGSYGAAANRYGIGIGDYSTGNYLSYNAEAAGKFILKAADGGIELSENGLIITNFTSTLDDIGSVIFKDTAAGEIGRTYAWFGGTGSYVGLVGGRSSWNAYSIVEINALNNGTYQASAMLTAQAGGAGPRAGVFVYDNGSNGWVVLDGTTYGIKANQGVTSQGIFRAEGGTLANGAANGGVEVGWHSTYGRVLSYNRTTASDQPLYLRGSEIRLREATTDIAVVNGGDFYRYSFQNYASTTVGWSSTTTKKVYVKDFGKWVFVQFEIYGTSNAGGSTKTFTLPYSNNSSIQAEAVHRNVNGFGMTILPVSSNVVSLYRDPAITAWQSSGTVWANGQFWYQRA